MVLFARTGVRVGIAMAPDRVRAKGAMRWFDGTAGTGPSYFKAWLKNGNIVEFGNTSDSQVLATGISTARMWALNKISDRKGNYLTVTYNSSKRVDDLFSVKCDVSDESQVEEAFKAIEERWGPVEVLVGVSHRSPLAPDRRGHLGKVETHRPVVDRTGMFRGSGERATSLSMHICNTDALGNTGQCPLALV